MAKQNQGQKFSGAAKVWEDFASQFPAIAQEFLPTPGEASSEEFRDEYIRLPYDDVSHKQEFHWE
jgi:hypothetical protein